MYKRLKIDEITKIQSQFFKNLEYVMKLEKAQLLKDLIKFTKTQGDSLYYLREGSGVFRIIHTPDYPIFIDEIEKIELLLPEDELAKLHSLMKNNKSLQKIQKNAESIKDTLEKEFMNKEWTTFLNKPYIVYDLETIWTTNDLKSHSITVGYIVESTTGAYKIIEKENAEKVLQYLRKFDGRIIGFYNTGFDNQVLCYNAGAGKEEIDELNAKSIDLFWFANKMLGKRIGLNKLTEALVGVKKTLSSGIEGAQLYKEYINTGEKKYFDQLKKYCKNDVLMTLLLFLYFAKYKKLYDEGNEIFFEHEDILQFGKNIQIGNEIANEDTISGLF